jgi:hypothetical protein
MAILTGAMPVGADAACSATAPGSNTTVTCSGAGISSVVAATGSTNVTINIDSTATGSFSLPGTPTPFSVDTSSAITSNGTLSLSGNGTGLANRGAVLIGMNNGNTITNGTINNSGTLTSNGKDSPAVYIQGNNDTLRNHGLLTTGRSVAEAFTRMYYLNKACEIQVTTLSAGQKVTMPSPEVCEHAAKQHDDYAYLSTVHLDREWTALLRLLDRDGGDYRC